MWMYVPANFGFVWGDMTATDFRQGENGDGDVSAKLHIDLIGIGNGIGTNCVSSNR